TSCTASPSRWPSPCSSPSTSGGCARTAASAGPCERGRSAAPRGGTRRKTDAAPTPTHPGVLPMSYTLSNSLQNGLAVYYLMVAAANVGFAAAYWFGANKRRDVALTWLAVAGLFVFHAVAYFLHVGWVIPRGIREAVDRFTGPVSYTVLAAVGFAALLYWRKFFVRPQVGWAILNLSLLVGGWSMTDPNFRSIVAKEDNVPITMLIYSVGFFTWMALYRAVQN